MSSQPPLPELPPMASAPSSTAERAAPAPVPQSASKAGFNGTRRLRQAITVVASGGMLFTGGVIGLELVARPGLRPTDLMATMEARTERGIFNQKMGQEAGELVLTEADYRAKLAEAERHGQAKAELTFQKELAVVQADKERVVGAYTTLYQRTNIIAQAGVQMETQALAFRQQLIEQTNGGRAMVISILDGLCAIGDADSCEKARTARAGMIEESSSLTQGKLAQKVRELMAGIDDPATLVAREDQRQRGTPALDR